MVPAIAGILSRWVSSRTLCLIGFTCALVSMMLLAFAHDHAWQLWTWPAIYAISYGLCVPAAYDTFMNSAKPDQASTVAAIGQTSGLVGASIAGAAITAILTAHVIVVDTVTIPAERSLEIGWWLGAGMAIVGIVAALSIRRPARTTATTATNVIEDGDSYEYEPSR